VIRGDTRQLVYSSLDVVDLPSLPACVYVLRFLMLGCLALPPAQLQLHRDMKWVPLTRRDLALALTQRTPPVHFAPLALLLPCPAWCVRSLQE
jgi:hypothetical protein